MQNHVPLTVKTRTLYTTVDTTMCSLVLDWARHVCNLYTILLILAPHQTCHIKTSYSPIKLAQSMSEKNNNYQLRRTKTSISSARYCSTYSWYSPRRQCVWDRRELDSLYPTQGVMIRHVCQNNVPFQKKDIPVQLIADRDINGN